VVLPSLSFVAAANSVRQLGAIPVFCDVDAESLCMSVETVAPVVSARTKVLLIMHYGGRPAGAEAIAAFARDRGIRILEDAALAAGMLDAGKWPGVRTDAAVYSFYATKNVTSGEGGMFVSNDGHLADRVRSLALHGMDRDAWKRYTHDGSWRYDVAEIGYKYNMPDIAAAIGNVQLRKLAEHQARREAIAGRYCEALERMDGVTPAGLGKMRAGDRHSWCMFVIAVDEARARIGRNGLFEALRRSNIGTSVHYIPTHHFSAYRDAASAALPVTDAVWSTLLSLPLYPGMSDADVDDVLDAIESAVNGARVATG
jgi:dTDP-4-amino-4,6-dideoxygalactose transaminase